MSSYDLKSIVKSKAKSQAFTYLNMVKDSKTKMENITYINPYKTLPYIEHLTRDQSSLLLALRTRTVRGIRSDFGNMYLDKLCPLPGCMELDSLPHVLICTKVQGTNKKPTQYSDVFSWDLEVQREAVITYSQLLNDRERILARQEPGNARPVHQLQPSAGALH